MYSERENALAEEIIADLQRRGIQMDGTITGEHGVGLALRDMLEVELGTSAIDMMRKVSVSLCH